MSRLSRNFGVWTALFALVLTLPWLATSAAMSRNMATTMDPQSPTATPTPETGKKKSKSKKTTEEATPTATPTPTPETGKKKSKKGGTAEPTPAAAATPEAANPPAAKGTPEKGTAATPAKTPPKTTAAGAPSESEIAAAKASGKVWVNLDSGVYHKGGRWYGNTKNGKFMTEAEAQKAGYREAQK